MQCRDSTHIHLSIIEDKNRGRHRGREDVAQRPPLAKPCGHRGSNNRLGLTTENGRLGIDLASLIASL